jgi:hypothetical protein
MSLRIACDLDGTVADMDAALQREAQRLFGPEVSLHAVRGDRLESAEDVESQIDAGANAALAPAPSAAARPSGRPLTPQEIRKLWQHVAAIENFWMSLGEVEPGAVARLAALTGQHRWEVVFLTQRPESAGDTTQVQSQRWLRAHGFDLPSVMVMRGSRGRVASALSLDVVLDDRPENCLDVIADSTAKPILVWRVGPARPPQGIAGVAIEKVASMAEAFTRLESMTAERAAEGSLFGRLRRALGRSR